jgi:hypothetical protein
VFTDALAVRVKAFYSITLSMNVICTCAFYCHLHSLPISLFPKFTGLIAFKIWKIQRATAAFLKEGRDELSRLVPIIVESGEGRILVVFECDNDATK